MPTETAHTEQVSEPVRHLVYPAEPRKRRPDEVILMSAAVALYVTFALGGIGVLVVGIAVRSFAAIFGVLWITVLALLAREAFFRTASRLDFTDGLLTWYVEWPWRKPKSGHLRSITYPTRPRQVFFETDHGKVGVTPSADLKPFIDAVHAADPTIVVDLGKHGPFRRWTNGTPPGAIEARLRRLAQHRALRYLFALAVAGVIAGTCVELSLTFIGSQQNAKTLRSDLARVHLQQAGYRTTAQRQIGKCQHDDCEIDQTWVWSGTTTPTEAAMCRDAHQVMKAAFGGVDPNTPLAAGVACDYYSIRSSILHPSQGKRTVDLIVRPGLTGGLVIDATASY